MSSLLWSLLYCGTFHLPRLGPSQPCVRCYSLPWFPWFYLSFAASLFHFYRQTFSQDGFFICLPFPRVSNSSLEVGSSSWKSSHKTAEGKARPVLRAQREERSGLPCSQRGLCGPWPCSRPAQMAAPVYAVACAAQTYHCICSLLILASSKGFPLSNVRLAMADICCIAGPFFMLACWIIHLLLGVVSFPQRWSIVPLYALSALYSGSLRKKGQGHLTDRCKCVLLREPIC